MRDSQTPASGPHKQTAPSKPLPRSMRTRRPWPMWPIALAIFLFIGIYTWVNLEFRKEGQAYEPFQAMMDRKNAIVEKNFYDWYSLKTTRPAQPVAIDSPASATSRAYPNVLDEVIPEQLKYYMPGRPILLPGFTATDAPATLTPGVPLPVTLHVPESLADDERLQLLAFYKEGDLFLLASLFTDKRDAIDPGLDSEGTVPVTFTVPTDPIAAESVRARLLTHERLSEWQMKNLDPAAAQVEETETAPAD